jgi:hypothetical protein
VWKGNDADVDALPKQTLIVGVSRATNSKSGLWPAGIDVAAGFHREVVELKGFVEEGDEPAVIADRLQIIVSGPSGVSGTTPAFTE